jgi:hypothetical protein
MRRLKRMSLPLSSTQIVLEGAKKKTAFCPSLSCT